MQRTSDIGDAAKQTESETHRIGTAREGATHAHCPNTDRTRSGLRPNHRPDDAEDSKVQALVSGDSSVSVSVPVVT